MTILNGHFDGERVVIDEPVPPGITGRVPVKIVFNGRRKPTVLDEIAKLAIDDDLPADYAEQLDHYVKGTPRK